MLTLRERHMAMLISMDMGMIIVSIDWKAHAIRIDEASPVAHTLVVLDELPVQVPIDGPPDKRVVEGAWALVEEGLVDRYGLITRKGRDAALEFAREKKRSA